MTIGNSSATAATVRFSRRMLGALATLILVPWIGVTVLAVRHVTAHDSATALPQPAKAPATEPSTVATPPLTDADPLARPEVFESRVGPWGRLQCVPIVLEVPDEYIFLSNVKDQTERWTFRGKSKAAAIEVLRSSGFSPEQIAKASNATWTDTGNGSSVAIDDDLILSLSPEVRGALYNLLALDEANWPSIDPFWFRKGRVDFRLRGSDLPADSVALLKRLLYPSRDGSVMLFADIRPALRSISDLNAQRKFYKAVSRKRSLMARLMITADSDIEGLANYWGADGRQKDLVPVLNSLKYNVEAGIESPSMINIIALLPSFARERLYNHAYANDGALGHKEDCFWTAFNFFSQYPDNSLNDMEHLSKVLERDYYKISEPTKLGDIVLIVDDRGQAIHAANYIADDIVFTKNGMNFTQPWILGTLSDLLETYKIKSTKIDVAYFRRK